MDWPSPRPETVHEFFHPGQARAVHDLDLKCAAQLDDVLPYQLAETLFESHHRDSEVEGDLRIGPSDFNDVCFRSSVPVQVLVMLKERCEPADVRCVFEVRRRFLAFQGNWPGDVQRGLHR